MFCTSCGTKNNEDANFCKQCGLKLGKPAQNRISGQDYARALPEDEQITALLERAYSARKDGDRLGAIALCHEALDLRPNSTSCHSLLGQLYEQGGERELAVEQYEKVLALNPGSIADRVKLDELRGDVPSVVTTRRQTPNIVIADRGKDTAPIDYRGPSFVLASVALMVLGGIFTMQVLANRGSGQRTGSDTTHYQAANTINAAGTQQQASTGGTQVASAQSAAPAPNSGFPGVTGFPDPVTIIQSAPTPSGNQYPPPGFGVSAAALTANTNSHTSATTNSSQDNSKDIDDPHVRLGTPEDGGKIQDVDPGPPPGTGKGSITVNQATTSQQSSHTVSGTQSGDASTGSNTRKNEAMAATLAQQGQYKQAGDAYLRALEGAGDDTAYVYRQAAWVLRTSRAKRRQQLATTNTVLTPPNSWRPTSPR